MDSLDPYHPWIDCASEMNCHSVRVNLRGSDNDLSQWTQNSIENLSKLCEYAKPLNINVIVENHGGFSSNADYLVNVIDNVDYDNVGTLPDFGNFCIKQDPKKSEEISRLFIQGGEKDSTRPPTLYDTCAERYDMYNGIEKLMKFAKGVSAKTHGFDSNGNDVDIDYKKINEEMLIYINDLKKIDPKGVVKSNFKGWHSKDFNLNNEIITKDDKNQFIFTGLQIINRSVFTNEKLEVFSLNKVWDKLIKDKNLLGLESNQKFYHLNTSDMYRKIQSLNIID